MLTHIKVATRAFDPCLSCATHALGRMPLVTTTTVRYGFSDRFVFSSARARRELGYQNRPLDDSIRDAFDWFRAQKML